jgi:CRP-like cAMP-binding protein
MRVTRLTNDSARPLDLLYRIRAGARKPGRRKRAFALESALVAKWNRRLGLDEDKLRYMLRDLGRRRGASPGEHLLEADALPRSCMFLHQGFAARYKLLSNGRRQITALYVAGDIVGLHDFLLGQTVQGIVTLSACQLILIDNEALRSTAADMPDLGRLLKAEALMEAEVAREWLVAMGRRNAPGRLAHFLCEVFFRLKAADKVDGNSFAFPLTQVDIADTLGLSVVHVNRVLKGLRRQQLISLQNQILTIIEWHELARLAEFDASYLGFIFEPSAQQGGHQASLDALERTTDG